jgi:hypothetical protein
MPLQSGSEQRPSTVQMHSALGVRRGPHLQSRARHPGRGRSSRRSSSLALACLITPTSAEPRNRSKTGVREPPFRYSSLVTCLTTSSLTS